MRPTVPPGYAATSNPCLASTAAEEVDNVLSAARCDSFVMVVFPRLAIRSTAGEAALRLASRGCRIGWACGLRDELFCSFEKVPALGFQGSRFLFEFLFVFVLSRSRFLVICVEIIGVSIRACQSSADGAAAAAVSGRCQRLPSLRSR